MKKIIQEWKELRREWLQDAGFKLEWMLLGYLILAFILSQAFYDFLFSIPLEALIGIVATILAIAMPLAILMMGRNSSETKFVLDQQVGVEKILNASLLMRIWIVLIMPPILFWNYSLCWPEFRSALLGLFGFGVFLFIRIIKSVYVWLNSVDIEGADNYTNRERLKYINTMSDDNWQKVWQDSRGRKLIGDEKLVRLFFKRLDKLAKNNPVDEKYKGVPILNSFIEKFDTINLRDSTIYEYMINFAIRGININPKTEADNPYHNTFASSPHELFNKVTNKSLGNGSLTHMWFKNIKEFPWEGEMAQSEFIRTMTYEFFDNLDNRDKPYSHSTVWEQFPKKWLITSENLKDKSNTFTRGWLREYKDWITERYYNMQSHPKTGAFDNIADNVTRRLLPQVDPITWSALLSFQLAPIDKNLGENEIIKSRIKGFIQGSEQFGFMGKLNVNTVTDAEELEKGDKGLKRHEELMKKQREEVFQINKITEICPILLDIDGIDKHLTFINHLKDYKPDSKEEYRKMRIARILNDAKEWLSSNSKK